MGRRVIGKENIGEIQKTVLKLEDSDERKNMAIDLLKKDANIIDVSEHLEERIPLDVSDTVFCAVFLCDVNRSEAIPSKWIKNFDHSKILNKGLNTTTKYIVYYSPNDCQKADFRTVHRSIYSSREPGVYTANILRIFGKCLIQNNSITIITFRILILPNDYFSV